MRRAVGLAAVAASLVLVAGTGSADRVTSTGTTGTPSSRVEGPALDAVPARAPARPIEPRGNHARPGRTAVLPPTHTVRAGDTLGAVGQRYGVTAPAVANANSVERNATLHPGQQLVIPQTGSVQPTTPEEVAAADLAVERLLVETAVAHGLDGALVQAVAWRESRWQQRVVSHRGAIGIMQVRPTTGVAVARHLDRELDLYDVIDNVEAGTAYLAMLLDRYRGDVAAALAGYHQGPQSVAERGRIPATQRYITDVMDLRSRFAEAHPAR